MGGERPYYEDRNWVRLALRQPFVYAPGEKFVYNNVGPYLAGILVQRRAGCDLVHYLMPRMFAPMGIQLPPHGKTTRTVRPSVQAACSSPSTNCTCSVSYCCKTAKWNGKQLIPAEWVKEATSKQVENGSEGLWLPLLGRPGVSFRADGNTASSSF